MMKSKLLNVAQIGMIRILKKKGWKVQKLAKRYHVSKSTVYNYLKK